jgi:leucyl/phenylalanyl-tRNA--protein transferase
MNVSTFPPTSHARSDGLLAIGGDLEFQSLLLAYRSGIFPWPIDEHLLAWYAPPKRAILFFKDLHISRSTHKIINKQRFTIRKNHNFRAVISACAEICNRQKQKSTWITKDMQEAYLKLHLNGYCHSYEAYLNNQLVGGLYGVQINKMFAGESMFYRESGASKATLIHLTNDLQKQGLEWLDCQVLNPFFESLGAKEVTREDFEIMLKKAIA